MICTDNAANNCTMMESLEALWNRQEILFNAKEQHIRCMAHVINLAVQAALKSLEWAPSAIDQKGDPQYHRDVRSGHNQQQQEHDSGTGISVDCNTGDQESNSVSDDEAVTYNINNTSSNSIPGLIKKALIDSCTSSSIRLTPVHVAPQNHQHDPTIKCDG